MNIGYHGSERSGSATLPGGASAMSAAQGSRLATISAAVWRVCFAVSALRGCVVPRTRSRTGRNVSQRCGGRRRGSRVFAVPRSSRCRWCGLGVHRQRPDRHRDAGRVLLGRLRRRQRQPLPSPFARSPPQTPIRTPKSPSQSQESSTPTATMVNRLARHRRIHHRRRTPQLALASRDAAERTQANRPGPSEIGCAGVHD